MTTRYTRVQALLEPDQHQRLREIAYREGRSTSEVIREVVEAGLSYRLEQAEKQSRDHRLAALDRLEAMRRGKPYAYAGDLVAETRAEREADEKRLWEGE